MTENRLNVFPSRMVLTGLKERTVAAKTGHSLLKRKSDAIKANLNLILKEILDVKRKLFKTIIREAYFSHTDAVFYAGVFNNQVIENTSAASYRIKTSIKNVAGVKLPIFHKIDEDNQSGDTMVGLAGGGREIGKCKEAFTKALVDLVRLASLQTSLKTLDDALRVTNRRVNALEFVVMPVLENTMKYVISELDELEREDNYRIKKVKDLRTNEAAAFDAAALKEKQRKRALGLAVEGDDRQEDEEREPPSILEKSEDGFQAPSENVTDIMGAEDEE